MSCGSGKARASQPTVGPVIINDGNGRYYEPGPARAYAVGLQWDLGDRGNDQQ